MSRCVSLELFLLRLTMRCEHTQSHQCPRLPVQDDDSYASGSSDEERRLAKPVFVTKGDRETVMEKEKAELEEAQLKEDEQKRKESRQVCSQTHMQDM